MTVHVASARFEVKPSHVRIGSGWNKVIERGDLVGVDSDDDDTPGWYVTLHRRRGRPIRIRAYSGYRREDAVTLAHRLATELGLPVLATPDPATTR